MSSCYRVNSSSPPTPRIGVFQLAQFLSSGVGVDGECAASSPEATPPHPPSRAPPPLPGQGSGAASHKLGFLGHRVEAPVLSFHFPFNSDFSTKC